MSDRHGVSFVVSCFNEAAAIVDTITRLHHTLKGTELPFEILEDLRIIRHECQPRVWGIPEIGQKTAATT